MSGPLTPGVWLGAWKIVNPWGRGYFGAHHTAIALVPEDGRPCVTELLGWRQEDGGLAGRNRVRTDSTPEYGNHSFSAYHWIQLAPVSDIARFQIAIWSAQHHFDGHPYWVADSNRFIAYVLWHAGCTLSHEQRQALAGWIPSFGSPHIADFPG